MDDSQTIAADAPAKRKFRKLTGEQYVRLREWMTTNRDSLENETRVAVANMGQDALGFGISVSTVEGLFHSLDWKPAPKTPPDPLAALSDRVTSLEKQVSDMESWLADFKKMASPQPELAL